VLFRSLPNGINLERYLAAHEFQNLHLQYKEKIRQFVIGHFFPSYTFNIDRTLYFFTSGRCEYRNKGFDLCIDALAQLSARMKESDDDRTVVFFLLSPRPHRSGSAEVLQTQAQMEEMRRTCDAIGRQMAERLLLATAQGRTPPLDELVDDYWRLRLLRLRHSWRVQQLPAIVTHDLLDDAHDEVLGHLRGRGLINRPEDPVKVVYYPDFLTPSIPLLGLEYDQFVRGCHLGVFPSSYEPWGYTPQECMARAVPAITSDLSGFGAYVMANIPDYASRGLFVVHRRGLSYESAVGELAGYLWDYAQLGRRGRIELRNQVEGISEHFDWSNLIRHYEEAYELVCRRAGLAPQAVGSAG
jgi:glycogen synthase